MITVKEATEQVAQAIEKHGAPTWVAYVPMQVRKLVPAEVKTNMIRNAKISEGWAGKQDGRNAIIAWCKANVFAEVTVKQLAEIGGCSEATVRTLINDRRDLFKKIEGRMYEVRDPEMDREMNR